MDLITRCVPAAQSTLHASRQPDTRSSIESSQTAGTTLYHPTTNPRSPTMYQRQPRDMVRARHTHARKRANAHPESAGAGRGIIDAIRRSAFPFSSPLHWGSVENSRCGKVVPPRLGFSDRGKPTIKANHYPHTSKHAFRVFLCSEKHLTRSR